MPRPSGSLGAASSESAAGSGSARRSMASVDRWEQLRPPTRLEPAATGRSGAEARGARSEAWKKGTVGGARIKGGPSQYLEEAAALAFFRVPRILDGCEVRRCDLCALVRPRVPAPPVSFYRYCRN